MTNAFEHYVAAVKSDGRMDNCCMAIARQFGNEQQGSVDCVTTMKRGMRHQRMAKRSAQSSTRTEIIISMYTGD